MRQLGLSFRRSRIAAQAGRSQRRALGFEPLEARTVLALAVPAFESLPGANQTIFLDFDGHVTQNTAWNNYFNQATITSPAYDTDGNPNDFSAAELNDIEETWLRVSEDYLPFNVNVTTKDPGVDALRSSGGGDSQWGVRAVITKDNVNCGCGGVAYVGSFTWDSDTPVFVFTTSDKYVAEAASHEVGHSLGLSHDGTSGASYYEGHGSGVTGWAPIMGVGYYREVTQWSKGEYYQANNTQDDLAIITGNNGFTFRADDRGDTLNTAAALTISGTSVNDSGLISRTNDVDVYAFNTGDGNVALKIAPAALGANLDIKAELLDAKGNVLATSDSASSLAASFDLTLSAGAYFLRIDGTGVGTPTSSSPSGYTEYGSLGQYSISGSITSPTNDSLSVVAADADKLEGSSGKNTFKFTVNRGGKVDGTTTVNYSVAGTGTSPADAADFDAADPLSGSLTFGPGETSQDIYVNINGDTLIESDETFAVSLSNPSGDTLIASGAATGKVRNDDAPPSLSVAAKDANKGEGTSAGVTYFTFTVTRSGDDTVGVTVNYKVSGATKWAASATDFEGNVFPSGSVAIPKGISSATINIAVLADAANEKNEGFVVTLSAGATDAKEATTISIASAGGTIQNDDTKLLKGRRIDDAESEVLVPVFEPLWEAHQDHEVHDHELDNHDRGGSTIVGEVGSLATSFRTTSSLAGIRGESLSAQAIDRLLAGYRRSDSLDDLRLPGLTSGFASAPRGQDALKGANILGDRLLKSASSLRIAGEGRTSSHSAAETAERLVDRAWAELGAELAE